MRLFKTPRQFYYVLPRDYWHVKEPMGQNFSPGTLRGYYIDMSEKASYKYKGLTKDTFPLLNKGREAGFQLLSVTVTQLALGHYEIWLSSQQPNHLEQFLYCADWLVEHQVTGPNGMGGWQYFFPIKRLGIEPPFISAMGQGQGISVLTRAHQLTKDEKYLLAAQRALEPFEYKVAEGGVKAQTEDGTIYYEEYPCSPYSHVLNGYIFALWGLYDYAIYQQDEHTMQLFDQGVSALKKYLPRYDTGFWSRYDLYPHPLLNTASPFYHELHIAQLRAMFKLTNVQEFDDFVSRWEKQFDNWLYFIIALYCKVRFKAWAMASKKNLPKTLFSKSEA